MISKCFYLKLISQIAKYSSFCVLAAKDKGEKKLFGFAFTPLMREDGTTLSDESHELYVYKVKAMSALALLAAIQLIIIISIRRSENQCVL